LIATTNHGILSNMTQDTNPSCDPFGEFGEITEDDLDICIQEFMTLGAFNGCLEIVVGDIIRFAWNDRAGKLKVTSIKYNINSSVPTTLDYITASNTRGNIVTGCRSEFRLAR